MTPIRRAGILLALFAFACLIVPSQARAGSVDFAAEIRPIFVQHCYDCHGPDDDDGGLQLSDYASVFDELPSGRVAVVAGEADSSELIDRVTHHDPQQRMPPRGDPLSDQQIDLLRQWIDQGAEWDDTHWAYTPLEEPAVPATDNTEWAANPIDHFVLATLEEQNVAPSKQADRRTLIRRLYIDLLGLPPTPEQVEAFVEDERPDAWERLVDRVLASPHFGERWGRHWLDMARYADSDGYLNDNEREDAWRYRDWVIDAINDDMPFDEFTVAQLAGDLLDDADPMDRLATAFHRQTLTNREAGVDEELYRVEAVFDRVETTAQVWLGLTANCARCHDHKYDDFSQAEYFRLYAYFNNAEETRTSVPGTIAQQQAYEADKQRHEQRLAAARDREQQRREELGDDLTAWAADLHDRLNNDAGHQHQPANVIRKHADDGIELTQLDDRSIRAAGDAPSRAKYMIDLHAEGPDILGFRLEALPDEDLPAGGPGRADDGTFALTELRVFAKPGPDVSGGDRLPFASAEPGPQEDKAWPAAAAIDGDRRDTAWGIAPDSAGAPREAVFLLDEPLEVGELTALRVVLDQQSREPGRTLGRFRIELITTPDLPDVPDEMRKLLAMDADDWSGEQRQELIAWRGESDDALLDLVERVAELEDNAPEPPRINARVLSQRDEPRDTYIMERGEYELPGEQVYPDVLNTLHPLDGGGADEGATASANDDEGGGGAQSTRLDLARWLMDDANPLTPRVTVNHIWMRLFGEGLVRTPDDFGVRGEPPTHPDLLNWLAVRYRENGWSRKAMIRLIVTSAAYRMVSDHRSDMASIDPDNRLLYRQNRFRAEAEIVRDLSLSAAGLLTEHVGGRSVFPPMQEDPTRARSYRWDTETDEQRYRRGMYTFFKRTAPYPNLVTFDCPDSNSSVVQRARSNTPLQALTTLNNEVYAEAARGMGQRIQGAAETDADRLDYAFRVALARSPDESERATLADLLEESRAWYADHEDEAERMTEDFRTPDVPAAEQAAWVVIASTLLNLDEFLTRP